MFYISGSNSSPCNLVSDTIGKSSIDTIYIKATALDSFGTYCDRFVWDVTCAEKVRFTITDSLNTFFHKNEILPVMVRNIDLGELRIIPNFNYLLGITKYPGGKVILKEDTLATFWTCTIKLSR
jgi:hypothetical protein